MKCRPLQERRGRLDELREASEPLRRYANLLGHLFASICPMHGGHLVLKEASRGL